MNTIKTGGPAYPRPFFENADGEWSPPQEGMSLRDWFAGQALAGFMANTRTPMSYNPRDAVWAYKIADAMLEAREGQS